MKKIGVMAGTVIDTQMGVELLKDKGFEAYGYSISKNCYEQDRLQYLSKEELENIVIEKILDMQKNNLNSCFVYCNSLSCAVDFKKISKKLNFKIITPFDAYALLGNDYKFLYILAANSLAAKNIEEFIKSINPETKFLSLGFLSLVNKIESCETKEEIMREAGIKDMFTFFEKVEPQIKSKAVLLACTHFPYIKEEIIATTNLNVVDPALKMIELL